MTVFDYLNLRYEWEDLVKKYRLPKGQADRKRHGTVENMKYFLDHGIIYNRFREGFDRAVEIAEIITNANMDKK